VKKIALQEERRNNFLQALQEKVNLHNVLKDRAEKLAEHLGISIGEAMSQLKAHIAHTARESKKAVMESSLGESLVLKSCEMFLEGKIESEAFTRILDEASVGDVHSEIHKGLVADVGTASNSYTQARKKHGEDHQITREAALGVHHAVNKVIEHLRSSGYKPKPNKVAVGGN
jgi:hypothetical protein